MLTEVAGFRYYEGMEMQLGVGMNAALQPEPGNPYDPQAIVVVINGKKVGYIGRGLLTAFHRWINSGSEITAVIEKMNGRVDRPSIMLFVSVVPQRQVAHAMVS